MYNASLIRIVTTNPPHNEYILIFIIIIIIKRIWKDRIRYIAKEPTRITERSQNRDV
jgi:hypothetical protein